MLLQATEIAMVVTVSGSIVCFVFVLAVLHAHMRRNTRKDSLSAHPGYCHGCGEINISDDANFFYLSHVACGS